MAVRDSIGQPWGSRTPYDRHAHWPVRVDSYLADGVRDDEVDTWVPTAAVLHSNGDGMELAVQGGRIVGVRGRADDRVNHGRLDPKDLFGWQANHSPDRLTAPLVRRDGTLVESTWDEAMERVVDHSRALLEQHGPGALGFYTSGQLFAEEYYTLAAIARGAIGTNHLDGNTRLCTATAAEALKETFGCDGQPASYTDGDLTGFRNWANDAHVADLARLWNVDKDKIPHDSPPTHLMRMLRYAEDGTIRLLWVSATNPAVSLPDLRRVRALLGQDRLFVIVQDGFRTETAELADVVLPTAVWGEKTGTFTNADRTVHLSDKAVDPPGQARSDLEIFLDYARRMDFRDKDGNPFPPWHDPESAFAAWQAASEGRPCDYSGLSYDKLRAVSGIQWPCTAEHPDGTERLYVDGQFPTQPDYCESYGRDLNTGESVGPDEYRAMDPDGRAMLKPAEHLPARETPTADFPFMLITGRTLYHFHTRTKTGRVPQLDRAAPEVWVEISAKDAERLDIADGDLTEIRSPRATVRARARVCGIRDGVLFLPFHYGYWDTDNPSGHDGHRAANELTPTDWDPASQQPLFKTGTANIKRGTSLG